MLTIDKAFSFNQMYINNLANTIDCENLCPKLTKFTQSIVKIYILFLFWAEFIRKFWSEKVF
jgi:hypothetical protein